MKKTNLARERINPHLNKNDDEPEPPTETRDTRASVERVGAAEQAQLKNLMTNRAKHLKSTANYSTASNEDG